jgi:hypothetical protein
LLSTKGFVAVFQRFRWAAAALVLLAVQVQAAPLSAQANTPLRFGETVRGELTDDSPRITYTFDMPPGQDVVVALKADLTVLDSYCVRLTTADDSRQECQQSGGGGGDAPTSDAYVIPAADDPDAQQTIDLSLVRPLSGAARYSLVAYLMDAQPAPLGDILAYQIAAEHPYRVYTLTADPAQVVTVEIEDSDDRGNFLWAAFQPYLPNATKSTNERLLIPQRVDGASRGDSVVGIQGLALYYLGGSSFRVLVMSTGAFSLHAASFPIPTLDAGDAASLTVSYREPLRVLRPNNPDPTARVSIDANVVAGTGALVMAYSQDYPYGEGLALGAGGRAGVPFPLFGTIDAGRSGDNLLVVVQIPFEFTRSQATVSIRWKVG